MTQESYALAIAEAVREAILVNGLEGEGLDTAMESIIASVPRPEPVAFIYADQHPELAEALGLKQVWKEIPLLTEVVWVDSSGKEVLQLPVYAEPPAPAESVNVWLLGDLAKLGRGMEHAANNAPAESLPGILREVGDRLLTIATGGDLSGSQRLDACISAAEQPQAQPTKCTNSDQWNCKYCEKSHDYDALNDERNFGTPVKPLPELSEDKILRIWQIELGKTRKVDSNSRSLEAQAVIANARAVISADRELRGVK